MKRLKTLAAATLILAIGATTSRAVDVWFDMNGNTTADSGVASQAYDWVAGQAAPQALWNLDSAGLGTGTAAWVNGDIAHFSAGGDGAGVTFRMNNGVVSSTSLGGLHVEEGFLIISGNAIALGANPARIDSGATLEIPGLSNVTVTTGEVLTLDGGTLRNTVQGVGSGQWGSGANGTIALPNAGTRIELTSNGGTIDTPNTTTGGYSIMSYGSNLATSVIGMTSGTTAATLIKKGTGEFRGLSLWTFTALDVQEGLYRINGTGGSDTGFGDVNGTVTTHGGAVAGTINGTSLGTSITITSPATRSFVFNNDLGADTMIVLNAGWTINGNISGPGGLMLNGWVRNDITTAASLIGSQSQNLTLGGTNTYGGDTTINFGTIVVTGGSAIPDASNVVFSSVTNWGNGTTTALNTAVLNVAAGQTETVGSIAGGSSVRGQVTVNAGSTLITDTGNNTVYSGAVTGAGNITKAGIGVLSIDREWANTGATNITGTGSIKYNIAAGGLGNSSAVDISSGASLDMNGINDTVGSLSGAGTVKMDDGGTVAGNLTLGGTAAGPITFSGSISKNAATTGGNLTKSGAGSTHILSGTNSVNALAANGGTLQIDGTTTASGGVTVGAAGTLGGNGTLVGAVTNNGTIAPGASVGTLNVTGNFTDGTSSIWNIELSGPTADKLAVIGDIDLTAADTLNILGTGTGSSWTIGTYTGALTGVFDTITSGYSVTYTGGNITLNAAPACAPGDANCDGNFNAMDYVLIRKLNSDITSGAGLTQYTAWRAAFTGTPGSGSGGGLNVGTVPEPASFGLLVVGLAAFGLGRRKRVA